MLLSHENLLAELPKLEKFSATERKRLNDDRRAQQIELWKCQDEILGISPKIGSLSPPQARNGSISPPQHPRKRKKNNKPHFDPGLVLLNCAALGDYDGVKRLLNQGVNPTVYNVDRITPLHQSCLENDEDITELLINAGCDIDSMDNELWTPLHAAVSLSNLECVEILLKNNANHLSPNVDGQLPIDLCEDKQIMAIMEQDLLDKGITQNDIGTARTSQGTKFFNDVKHLLETGGNPNFQLLDNDATLLHVAAANGFVEVALYLLTKVCKMDIQDIDGWTPLHAAAFWGEVDIIELLAAHGANFKIRTYSGELPFDLTEDTDVRMLVQRLSERSELMKRHPVLRPSSVRGRLVSRMTTDEREDKRRESAELHSVFVEQIGEDFSKAPDSWRIRTGKYVRPALRDISFEHPTERKSVNSMTDVLEGLEGSDTPAQDSPRQWFAKIHQDNSTNDGSQSSLVCVNQSTDVRREDNLEDSAKQNGEERPSLIENKHSSLSITRSTSLVGEKPASERHVTRYYSFRQDMQETPRFSPKPKNNKSAYKNRKKAGSSASKVSSGADDDTLTYSLHSSGDLNNSYLVAMPKDDEGTTLQQPSETVDPPALAAPDSSALAERNPTANSVPLENKPVEPLEIEEKKKKETKCCVIL